MADTTTTKSEKPLSLLDWLGTLVLMVFPIVNFVAVICYALGAGNNKTRTNLFRLILLCICIVVIISICLYSVVSQSIHSMISTLEIDVDTTEMSVMLQTLLEYIQSLMAELGIG